MPEPVNPHSGMATRGAWADCDRAWRAWLASDEAVERATRAVKAEHVKWTREVLAWERAGTDWSPEDFARAVLAALRGEADGD